MERTFDIDIVAGRRVPGRRAAGSAVARFLAGLGQGVQACATARARAIEFERLNAMSDAQLARMGLTRCGIGRHVFRDMLYL